MKGLKSLTTTVGVVTAEGVVLATDRRVTSGFYVAHKRARKIWKIDDHIAATMSGGVADLQHLLDVLTAEARAYRVDMGKPVPVRSIANMASLILFQARPSVLIVHVIIGGWDQEEGPVMYMLDWLGSLTKEPKFIATGSGSPYALGVLEAGYREDLSISDAVDLAIRAVRAAASRDPGSGEGVDVVAISREGYREIFSAEAKLVVS